MARKIYGIKEIAEAIGQHRATVWAWLSRGVRDIPPPDDRISAGPVWLAETIEPWIQRFTASRG